MRRVVCTLSPPMELIAVSRLGMCSCANSDTSMYITMPRAGRAQHNLHSCSVVLRALQSDWCPKILGRIHAG